jgi:hypothetical protein
MDKHKLSHAEEVKGGHDSHMHKKKKTMKSRAHHSEMGGDHHHHKKLAMHHHKEMAKHISHLHKMAHKKHKAK